MENNVQPKDTKEDYVYLVNEANKFVNAVLDSKAFLANLAGLGALSKTTFKDIGFSEHASETLSVEIVKEVLKQAFIERL